MEQVYDIDLLSIEDMQRALNEAETTNIANDIQPNFNDRIDDRRINYEARDFSEVILVDSSAAIGSRGVSVAAAAPTLSSSTSSRVIEAERDISPLNMGAASEVYSLLSQVGSISFNKVSDFMMCGRTMTSSLPLPM